jgi:hypothetical protein
VFNDHLLSCRHLPLPSLPDASPTALSVEVGGLECRGYPLVIFIQDCGQDSLQSSGQITSCMLHVFSISPKGKNDKSETHPQTPGLQAFKSILDHWSKCPILIEIIISHYMFCTLKEHGKIQYRSCPCVHCSELLVGSQPLRANARSLHKYTGMLCSWPWFTTIQSFTVEKGEFCFNLVWLPELFNVLQFPLFDVATVDDVSLKKADFPASRLNYKNCISRFSCISFATRAFVPMSFGRIHRSAEFRTYPLNPPGWTGRESGKNWETILTPRKLHRWMINLPNKTSWFLDVKLSQSIVCWNGDMFTGNGKRSEFESAWGSKLFQIYW